MLAVLLALVIVWIVLGIVGFVVHGLFWLFVIACVLFVATVLGGAFLVEQVFGLPGLGVAALNAAKQGDYPVVQAAALYTTVAFLFVSLAVDVLQAALDVKEGEDGP